MPPVGYVGVPHRLPRGRQHVGEEQEPLVRAALRHLDRAEVRLRDPQVLGLPAGDRPVERGVAEQRRTLALLPVLRRLALGEQPAVAHPARPAGDVERDDDAVPGLDVGDLGADLLDDAHRLVAQDVAGLQVRAEHLVEMQVGPADRGRRDADDRVGRAAGSSGRARSRRGRRAFPARSVLARCGLLSGSRVTQQRLEARRVPPAPRLTHRSRFGGPAMGRAGWTEEVDDVAHRYDAVVVGAGPERPGRRQPARRRGLERRGARGAARAGRRRPQRCRPPRGGVHGRPVQRVLPARRGLARDSGDAARRARSAPGSTRRSCSGTPSTTGGPSSCPGTST